MSDEMADMRRTIDALIKRQDDMSRYLKYVSGTVAMWKHYNLFKWVILRHMPPPFPAYIPSEIARLEALDRAPVMRGKADTPPDNRPVRRL